MAIMWEYKIEHSDSWDDEKEWLAKLNELGEKGWELISNSNDDGYGTFKRPVQK